MYWLETPQVQTTRYYNTLFYEKNEFCNTPFNGHCIPKLSAERASAFQIVLKTLFLRQVRIAMTGISGVELGGISPYSYFFPFWGASAPLAIPNNN